VKSVSMPEGVTNLYRYTTVANMITKAFVTDGRGHETAYEFDGFGQCTLVAGPRGDRTVMTWNSKGQKQTETDPEGMTMTFGYDARNNPNSLKRVGADKTEIDTSTVYDPVYSKPSQMTDGNGNTT